MRKIKLLDILIFILGLIISAKPVFAETVDDKLHVYATGSYEVWGGMDCVDGANYNFYYNINSQPEYTYLGGGNGNATFRGGYRYYVVVTRSHFALDAIRMPNGAYLWGESNRPGIFMTCGNVHVPFKYDASGKIIGKQEDYFNCQYITGAPDTKTNEVGGANGGSKESYQGYIAVENCSVGDDISEDRTRGRAKYGEFETKDPINIATGNMYVAALDVSVPGAGLSFEFIRTYNSRSYIVGPLGYGWTHSYNVSISFSPFDLSLNTTWIDDEEGKRYTFVYNPAIKKCVAQPGEYSTLTTDGKTIVWTKKDGKKYTFDYVTGKLLQIADRHGNAITLSYDASLRLKLITDTVGRKAELTCDARGRITYLRIAGRDFEYSYDPNGDLADVTDCENNRTHYDYDSNHNLTCITDTRGHKTYFSYDAVNDRCIRSHGEGNLNLTDLTFAPDKKMTVVADSKGNAATHYYNDNFLITKIVNAQNGVSLNTWDASLNKTSSTDELNHQTKMEYDAKGNLTKLTDAMGNKTVYTYELVFNLVKTITDAQSGVTTNSYDAEGNLTKSVDALGGTTSYGYDGSGRVTGTHNALGKGTYYAYDPQGNLRTVTDALGAATSMSYDQAGNMISSQDSRGNTTQYSYDKMNRLTQTTFADRSTIKYAYDAAGNRTSIADQMGNITNFDYNQAGKVITKTDALGYKTYYDYDSEENLICVTDQNNNKTTYEYDAFNRRIAETDAQGSKTHYGYDAVGNRTSVTDARGQKTTYVYDYVNRLTKTTYPDSTTANYVYDSLSRRTSMTDNQGKSTYTYDKLSRLLTVDGPLAKDTVTYTYDAVGNRLTMVDPDAKTTKYAYDVVNRVSIITDPLSKVTTYVYDLAGNLTNLTYPNGTRAVYTYDALNHLTKLTNQKTAAPNIKLSEYAYTYDAAGRRTEVTLLDGSGISYTYDAIGQLISEANNSGTAPYSITYAYDYAGNRTSKIAPNAEYNYVYNSLNQLIQENVRTAPASTRTITVSGTISDKSYIAYVSVNGIKAQLGHGTFTCAGVSLSSGSNTITAVAADVNGNTTTKTIHVTYQPESTTTQIAYTYDPNGNLITRNEQDKTINLTYDSQNRLISFSSPSLTETYQYDSEGKRTGVRCGSSTTSYLYDGMSVVMERNSSGATVATYNRNPLAPGGIGGIISSVAGAQTNYYHYDGIGTVTALSNASAAITQTCAYDAFGNVLSQSGSAANNRGFLTKETSSTSLVYFGARYYDPKIGRFISKDPSGFVDGPNVYIYCHNNPPNAVDLWGRDTYYINNNFNSPDPTWSPISHSFIAITSKDSSGKEKVIKAFSWTSANGGSWEDTGKAQNIQGAQNAIDKGFGAWKKGDATMDHRIESTFEKVKNEKGGYWPFDGNTFHGTCKNQANRLIENAGKNK